MTSKGLAVGFLALILSTVSRAGSYGNCRSPTVFPDVAVNLVFLPFQTNIGTAGRGEEFSTEIPLLMKLATLPHIIPYGDVGAVQLAPSQAAVEECTAQSVIDKLIGKQSFDGPQIRQGHGLIVVSGRLYREGDDYFIKTFIAFQRRDTSEQIQFTMDDFILLASPSTQVVAFQPRHLTKEQLLQVRNAYIQANVIRESPSVTAPGQSLSTIAKCSGSACVNASTGYWVTEVKDDWFHVSWINPLESNSIPRNGWIHADSEFGGQPLQDFLPELYFIRALTGYLMMRSGNSAASVLTRLSQDFDSYLEHDQDNDDEAAALAYELRGIAKAAIAKDDLGLSDFDKAIPLNPSSSDLRNTDACIRIWGGWNESEKAWKHMMQLSNWASPPETFRQVPKLDGKSIVETMRSAIALSPIDHTPSENLLVFFKAARSGLIDPGLPSEELEKGIKELTGESTTSNSQVPPCEIWIFSPLPPKIPADKIPKEIFVSGRAKLVPGAHLWVFSGIPSAPDEWWPQGGDERVVLPNGYWEVSVKFPEIDKGLIIRAIAVDSQTNKWLKAWSQATVKSGPVPIKLTGVPHCYPSQVSWILLK